MPLMKIIICLSHLIIELWCDEPAEMGNWQIWEINQGWRPSSWQARYYIDCHTPFFVFRKNSNNHLTIIIVISPICLKQLHCLPLPCAVVSLGPEREINWEHSQILFDMFFNRASCCKIKQSTFLHNSQQAK